MTNEELQAIKLYTDGEYLKDSPDDANRKFGRYCSAMLDEIRQCYEAWNAQTVDIAALIKQNNQLIAENVNEAAALRASLDELSAINGHLREQLTKSEQAYMAEHAALVDAKAQLAAVPVDAIWTCIHYEHPTEDDWNIVIDWLETQEKERKAAQP